ncbi:hypothetical protein [uncultured Hyphomicrobium sp.]|uniref:hypothetical protein n=1 Tax=uncultured Hyphomicrobium sp. TaxID=194373 RepID=UPI0025F40281|nr:hypothetical protein [uncultured Hyphomicrobium sp.]
MTSNEEVAIASAVAETAMSADADSPEFRAGLADPSLDAPLPGADADVFAPPPDESSAAIDPPEVQRDPKSTRLALPEPVPEPPLAFTPP